MSPTDEGQIVSLHELLDYVPAKGVGDPPVTLTPAKNILERGAENGAATRG